jgi:hypothetical protein
VVPQAARQPPQRRWTRRAQPSARPGRVLRRWAVVQPGSAPFCCRAGGAARQPRRAWGPLHRSLDSLSVAGLGGACPPQLKGARGLSSPRDRSCRASIPRAAPSSHIEPTAPNHVHCVPRTGSSPSPTKNPGTRALFAAATTTGACQPSSTSPATSASTPTTPPTSPTARPTHLPPARRRHTPVAGGRVLHLLRLGAHPHRQQIPARQRAAAPRAADAGSARPRRHLAHRQRPVRSPMASNLRPDLTRPHQQPQARARRRPTGHPTNHHGRAELSRGRSDQRRRSCGPLHHRRGRADLAPA